MAEVVAALALGSSIISFMDMGGKVITRVREYIETSQEVPEVLRDISDRLETLLLTTKNLESALNAGELDDGAKAALRSTVAGLERQALILQGLCEHILPSSGDMWWQKARKAVSSLRKEKELKNVLQKIIAYESTLNLYFTTAMSLKDSSSLPWTQRTYHDIPPFAFGRCIGRRRVLDQVAASFRMDNLEHRMITVLLGIGGQGKTMIAREYCRRQRDHISLFWIDASSYSTALSGMQRASQLFNSSTESDPSSHMQRLPATNLEKLLHPFLIVLDNMDHANDFTQIMQLMPENKMCMVLITSRHRDVQQLGTCIEIKPMEQDEAVELLLTKCRIASDLQHHAHAESIVKTLAHLPLAIDQAGAYISSRNLPLEQFIDHFNNRKKVIMNCIPSGWPYQKAHDGQQRMSDLCVFTTWELSLDELGSSVNAEPFIDLLTFAAFAGPSYVLAKMLRTQAEENLAAELGCRDLYTSEGKWDPWKYQDTIVQLYSVSLISEIDMSSAEIEFVIHPLVEEWLKVRAGDPKDKMYIEANTELIHRICDRHNERVENLYVYERQVLPLGILSCATNNMRIPATGNSRYSEVFLLALPSFVRCLTDCGESKAAYFWSMINACMESESGFVMTPDLLPRFWCEILSAGASMAVYDSEWREKLGILAGPRSLQDLNPMLEGDPFKELRPDERCVLRLKLLYGQFCIALGEVEAARQLLTDGFATSRQTFGTGDILTMEFQTSLAEVYIERRDIELADTYLNPLIATRSGRSDICDITARALGARVLYIMGSLVEAESLLWRSNYEALAIVGDDHSMIWRMQYDLVEVYLRQEDFSKAEVILRDLRDRIIEAKGPEHLEVLHVTLDLARLKIATGETEEAGQICQTLLVQQQKRDADTHDLINLTKAVWWLSDLWLSNRHSGRIDSGRIDSENGLEIDLLKSLESGPIPNPKLARKWDMVARLARYRGAVDVASVLKKHRDKAMELAFGIEYLQAMDQDEASREDSNNGLFAGTEASANLALRVERSIFHVWNA